MAEAEVKVVYSGDSKSLEESAKRAERATEASTKKITESGEKAEKTTEKSSEKIVSSKEKIIQKADKMAKVVGISYLAMGASALKFGGDFETSMAKVSTMFGDVDVDMKNLKDQVLKLSSSTGESAESLAGGLYSALSAGIPVTEDMGKAMAFMEKNARLAKAGFTGTEEAVGATAKILKSYQYDVSETDRVHRILMQTQNNGITTIGEISASISQVTPTASAMGVAFEEVGASLATMTSQGIPTAQSTTALNNLIAELGKEGTKASRILKEKTSKSFQELQKDGHDLSDILNLMGLSGDKLSGKFTELAKETGGNTEEAFSQLLETTPKAEQSLIDMFGSLDAGKAALTLAGANTEKYKENLTNMKSEVDVVGEAYDKMANTMEGQLNIALQNGKNLLIKLFDVLRPVAMFLLNLLNALMDHPTVLALIAGSIGVLVVAYTAWRLATKLLTIATNEAALAQLALLAPIALIVLAVMAVVASFTILGLTLHKHFSKPALAVKELGDVTTESGEKISEGTAKAVHSYLDLEKEATTSLKKLAWSETSITDEIANDLNSKYSKMKDTVVNSLNERKEQTETLLNDLFAQNQNMTKEERKDLDKQIANAKQSYDKQIEATEKHHKQRAAIINTARKENRALSKEEQRIIESIDNQMRETAVRTLSESEAEQLAIMEHLKTTSGKISALQAVEIVKNSKEQTDKTIAEANKEYQGRLSEAARLRADGTEESSALADSIVKEATRQRDETISIAEETHGKIIEEAKAQAGEHIGTVNWETGEIKTKWQVFADDFVQDWVEYWGMIGTFFSETWEKISEWFGKQIDTIKNFFIEKWESLRIWFTENLEATKQSFMKIWNELKYFFGTLLSGIVSIGKEKFDTMKRTILNSMDTLKTSIEKVLNGIKTAFRGVLDFITGVFTGDWRKAWEAVKSIFRGIVESLAVIMKGVLNGIISSINSGIGSINTLIKGVNAISGKIGIPSIPTIPSIPRLKMGMDFVPSDFFPAYLDYGERVLTKEENQAFNAIGGLNGLAVAQVATSNISHGGNATNQSLKIENVLHGEVNLDGFVLGQLILKQLDKNLLFR